MTQICVVFSGLSYGRTFHPWNNNIRQLHGHKIHVYKFSLNYCRVIMLASTGGGGGIAEMSRAEKSRENVKEKGRMEKEKGRKRKEEEEMG